METLANQITNIIPEKYRWPFLLLVALGAYTPFITRAFFALKNNGGIRGILSAIWYGTNVPVQQISVTSSPASVVQATKANEKT